MKKLGQQAQETFSLTKSKMCIGSTSKCLRASICCGAPLAAGAVFNIIISGLIALFGIAFGIASADVPELQIWPYFGVCKYLVDVDPEECREVMFPYIIAMNAFLLVIAFMLLNALCIWTFLDDETDDHKIRKKQRKIKNILKAWLVLDLIHRLIEIAFNHWLGYPSNASSFCVYMAYMGFRAHGWIVVYLLYQEHKNKCREQGLENGDNPENTTDTSRV